MLGELAGSESQRLVSWVHVPRPVAEHAHRLEAEELLRRLSQARAHVRYSAVG